MKSKNRLTLGMIAVVAAVTVLLAWLYLRPIPEIAANHSSLPTIPAENFTPSWPTYGQAGVGAVGFGALETNGPQNPLPTASVAKIVTALAVLQKDPLGLGEKGPILTLDAQDVQFFEKHYINGGSVVAVKNGEQISLYQALQAMLLPSGNNMADSLARWAFGSQEKYLVYANSMLKTWGLKNTIVADASGYSPSTVSTASDLLSIAQKAVDSPVLAQVVSQPTATVPVAGEVKNVNWLLGEDGVVGIKTGSTDQAGGNFLFAAKRTVAGQNLEVIGVILGAPARNTAISDSRLLIRSLDEGFEKKVLLKKGQVVGTYSLPWGGTVNAVAKSGLDKLVWKNQDTVYKVSLSKVSAGAKQGATVGLVSATNGEKTFSVPIVLQNSVSSPPLKWKFLRN